MAPFWRYLYLPVQSTLSHALYFSTRSTVFPGDHIVKNPDAAFILSYAIILLNVDQHNPKNKRPMTIKDFLRNQRKLNDKEDFPPEFLERIYNNIRSREIVMPDEHVGELKVR